MTKRIGHLHVITDETVQSRFSHFELAERAIDGGADTIQFRDKTRGARELVQVAVAIARLCHERNVVFIVNDRVDVAIAAGADGVHLGRRDLPLGAARRLAGPGMIIGGTASTLEEAMASQDDGADYVGFGHIYPTSSKVKRGAPMGPDSLRGVSRALRIPIVAIGGIDQSNFLPVFEAGAWGIAVISSVCATEDPAAATRIFRKGIDSMLEKRSQL
jgi:thiamine-phosphate pyrophosphorylase